MGQMRQELVNTLRHDLRPIMAPQTIQAIEILQLPTAELIDLVKMEMDENPALDLAGPARLEETGLGNSDEASSGGDRPSSQERTGENSDDFERLDTFEADERFRDSFYDSPAPKKSFDGEDKKHEALQNTAARPTTLQDHLFEQFSILELNDLQKLIGEQIIYNIDSNGFLRYRLENIVDQLPRTITVAGLTASPETIAAAAAAAEIGNNGNGNGTTDDENDDDGDDGDDGDEASGSAEMELLAAGLAQSLQHELDADDNDDDANTHDGDGDGDEADGEDGKNGASSSSNNNKRMYMLTASGRYRRRRKNDAPALKDVVPMSPPPVELLRYPRDEYFEALYAEAEEVLAIIRTLDPPGVGAYDLKECLELQLTPDLPYASLVATLIEHHLDDLMKNRLPKIAKETGRRVEEVKEAMSTLALLNPRPGSNFAAEGTAYIVPDVTVSEVDGRYLVIVEDQYIPSLRISPSYDRFAQDSTLAPEARQFAKRKIDAARWLQDAIEQRRYTLQRVAESIVEYQKKFFDEGVTGLVPLKMQDVADKLGLHVSTISRAVSEKFIDTPRGVFEMKYFFRGGTKTTDGDEESTEIVKQRVKQIVDAEPPENPLSDDAIAEKLEKELGLKVARRTVTKYRKQLGIPSSRDRRRY